MNKDTLAVSLAGLLAAGCALRGAPPDALQPRDLRVDVRSCTCTDLDRWNRLRCGTLGVDGSDRWRNLDPRPLVEGETAPPSVLVREGNAVDGFHTWVPVSDVKEAACGRPVDYEENCATSLGLFAECDLNNDVRPDPGSLVARYLDVLRCDLGGQDDIWPDPQGALCFTQDVVHAEITPPQMPARQPYGLRRELRSLWHPRRSRAGWLQRLWDGRACFYGPFVGDRGHLFKPEIHPAQLVWWNEWPAGRCRDARAPDGPFALLLLQDASTRFTGAHHFYLRERPAERWRPWAAGPLDGTFRTAFWSRPDDPPAFKAELLFGGRPAATADGAPPRRVADRRGRTLAWLDDGALRGELPGWARVSLDVERACRDADGALLGILRVQATAGTGRDWEEGHAALRLSDSRAAAAAAARDTAPDADEPRGGELAAEDEEAPAAARAGRNCPQAARCERMCPEPRTEPPLPDTPLPDTPLPRLDARIVLRESEWVPVGTSPDDGPAVAARRALLHAFLGGPLGRALLPGVAAVPVVGVRHLRLHAVADVDVAVAENPRRLDDAPAPSFNWSVSVVDVLTGRTLEAPRVRVEPRGADCRVAIDGAPGAVYEVRAALAVAGRFTDTSNGRPRVTELRSTRRQRLWTHALAFDDSPGGVRRLAALFQARPTRGQREYDRLLELAAARAVTDGRVTVSELRLLARQSGLPLAGRPRAVPLTREWPLDLGDTAP